MDPRSALDRHGADGPPLRRWEAALLSELRHGESGTVAALTLFFTCVIAIAASAAAVNGTCEFLGVTGRTGPATWTSLTPWLLAMPATVLASIEYRWWRWLSPRPRGRHRM